MESHQSTQPSGHLRPNTAANATLRSASFEQRTRSEDSWIDISSQPSSSSLSSAADEVITTGLRVQHDPRSRKRRSLRQNRPTNLNLAHRPLSVGGTSSQEEYDESESESDHVMTSSGEAPFSSSHIFNRPDMSPAQQSSASEDSVADDDDDDNDDENRTAINHPLSNDQCFTPQPNAFSHPPSGHLRNASQPVPGSYFPSQRPAPRSTTRHSAPTPNDTTTSNHIPHNILSPSYTAAAQHDEALRSSLTTLLSCAAAARSLPKAAPSKRQSAAATTAAPPARSNKVEPMSLRLIPESQLPNATATSPPQFHEPTFKPTIRRDSTSTSTSSATRMKDIKRKAAGGRTSSRERRAVKKARQLGSGANASIDDLQVSPTLLTWVVSAGVVVLVSALSFSAGYGLGKEAGRIEAAGGAGFAVGGDAAQVRSCAREAGRSGLGLRRSLARSAVQV